MSEANSGFKGHNRGTVSPVAKERVDKELVRRELVESRERAQILVMAGLVFAGEERIVKPSQLISPETALEVRGKNCPYVSRGGLKLEAALDAFSVSVEGLRCLDLGASTGGFTDLLLQRGAASVSAVDVGRGQLHWKLRSDPRVKVYEKTNARYLTPEHFAQNFDFITGDLSFIGLHHILPAALPLASPQGRAIFLIKPQFEAGRHQVGKNGVVRDPKVHQEVLLRILSGPFVQGFEVTNLTTSPLKGPAGNIEYLFELRRAEFGDQKFELVPSVERELVKVRKEWVGD